MMAVNKDVIEDAGDVASQLAAAEKSMQDAKDAYEKLKKKAADDFATKINALVKTAQFDAEEFFSRCFSTLIKDSDTAISIATQMLNTYKPDDSFLLNALNKGGLLTSVSVRKNKKDGTAGQRKSGEPRKISYRYKLEEGEQEKLRNNQIKEGMHRHDPAHWCPKQGASKSKPDWFNDRYAEFVISKEEKEQYDKRRVKA
jgi:hypothetical protein